ncbi:hypothetical protein LINPERPRIM_LOCUS25342 [Linum perenne]
MYFSLKFSFVKIVNMISGRKNSYQYYHHYLLRELKIESNLDMKEYFLTLNLLMVNLLRK